MTRLARTTIVSSQKLQNEPWIDTGASGSRRYLLKRNISITAVVHHADGGVDAHRPHVVTIVEQLGVGAAEIVFELFGDVLDDAGVCDHLEQVLEEDAADEVE